MDWITTHIHCEWRYVLSFPMWYNIFSFVTPWTLCMSFWHVACSHDDWVFIVICFVCIPRIDRYIAAPDYEDAKWSGYTQSETVLCSNENATEAAIEAYNGSGIAVSCCSDDGLSGYRPDCDAYAKTYDEAKTICEGEGYRLCTLQELYWDKVTAGEVCEFDWRFNWVSDECGSWVYVQILLEISTSNYAE